jgi:hypothetical protein
MPDANVSASAVVLGKTITRSLTVAADGAVVKDPTIAVAKTGTLSTRTNDTEGTLTMTAGHGITTGNRLDIYWGAGKRVGVTVGTVATNSVPFTGGAGDNLPIATTAITAMVPHLELFPVPDTSELLGLFASSTAAQATLFFRDSNGDPVATISTTGTTGGYIWEDTSGVDNPLDAEPDVADVYMSHSDSATARQVNVIALIE